MPRGNYNLVWELLLISGLSLLFFLLSTPSLDKPGLYYDEALHSVATVHILKGKVNGPYITVSRWVPIFFGRPFPHMTMIYIGALKSYIFLPFFSLLGINVFSIRLTTIIVGWVALLFTYLFTREIFGKGVAFPAVILLATDPSFIFFVREDWGPVAIMLLCKTCSLFLLSQWWKRGSLKPLSLGGFFLGLGIYDKANFIWFLLALAISAVIFYKRGMKERIKIREALVGTTSFCIGAGMFLLYNIATLGKTFWPLHSTRSYLLQSIPPKIHQLYAVLNGTSVFEFIFRRSPDFSGILSGTPLPILFIISLGLTIFLTWNSSGGMKTMARKTLFLLSLMIIILIQIFVTPLADGGHHTMMLYPFPHIMIGIAILQTLSFLGSREKLNAVFHMVGRYAIVALVVGTIISNGVVIRGYYRELKKTGGIGHWSDAINELVSFLEGNDRQTVVCMDWGFNQQILTLSQGRIKTLEPFWNLLHHPDYSERLKEMFSRGDYIFLFHSLKYTKFINPLIAFQRTLEKSGATMILERKFHQKDGDHVYSLYKVSVKGHL